MDKKKPFVRIAPRDSGARSGERVPLTKLDLDLAEFLEEEPITKPVSYIDSLKKLRAIIMASAVVRPRGFQKHEFAARLRSMGMYSHDRGEDVPYYITEDLHGNQFRVYANPAGKVNSPKIDCENRMVLMHGDDTYYIFPVVWDR